MPLRSTPRWGDFTILPLDVARDRLAHYGLDPSLDAAGFAGHFHGMQALIRVHPDGRREQALRVPNKLLRSPDLAALLSLETLATCANAATGIAAIRMVAGRATHKLPISAPASRAAARIVQRMRVTITLLPRV